MESTQTMNITTPEDGDLSHATVRELIVQLTLVEDEHRKATSPSQIAALARREQTIVVALHGHGLGFKSPGILNMSETATTVCSADDAEVKECR
ncbi:hypothetical protein [Arthrobacter glacialis]|nr:hypothetical protein [Arthrobacter glacialis]